MNIFLSRKRGEEDKHTGSSKTGIRRKKIHNIAGIQRRGEDQANKWARKLYCNEC